MKNYFFILIIFIGLTSKAQNTNKESLFGFKLGANFATIGGDNTSSIETRFAYHFGLASQLKFTNSISLAPEVLFSSQGAKQTFDGSEIEVRLNYVMLPVSLRYYASENFYFETGPQVGFLVSSKQSSSSSNDVDVVGIKSQDLSLNLGIGFKSKEGFLIGVRYNFGLTDIDDLEFVDTKKYNRVFMLSLGYLFKN